jgi:hypothetical protein
MIDDTPRLPTLDQRHLHRAREHMMQWWRGEGLVVTIVAPRENAQAAVPSAPADVRERWLDVDYRIQAGLAKLANNVYLADAVPYFEVNMGPGSLGTFLGSEPVFEPETVWYQPCIDDPDADADEPIRLETDNNRWLDQHLAFCEALLERCAGRCIVAMPDLIENVDTLAALRGSERLLLDLVERGDWVERRVWEINDAFFAAFELFYQRLSKQVGGGNAFFFDIWSPGPTAKVQCDFSCMISPAMFRRFVMPALAEQCRRLDYSMYHLDGEGALGHLDALLEIDSLDAIEWTPTGAWTSDPQNPRGGSPAWFDMYRRIKSAGKSVQAIGLWPSEVAPLIDAVGPDGLYIQCHAASQREAEQLASQLESWR